jgi:hypothetical protein
MEAAFNVLFLIIREEKANSPALVDQIIQAFNDNAADRHLVKLKV